MRAYCLKPKLETLKHKQSSTNRNSKQEQEANSDINRPDKLNIILFPSKFQKKRDSYWNFSRSLYVPINTVSVQTFSVNRHTHSHTDTHANCKNTGAVFSVYWGLSETAWYLLVKGENLLLTSCNCFFLKYRKIFLYYFILYCWE